MAEEKKRLDLDKEFQEKRIKEHLADPNKNKEAWRRMLRVAIGRSLVVRR